MEDYVMMRALTIVKNREILLVSHRNNSYHWLVMKPSKIWVDVWARKDGSVWLYDCNAVEQKKKLWGCVLTNGDRSVPRCSHTIAARLWLKKNGVFK